MHRLQEAILCKSATSVICEVKMSTQSHSSVEDEDFVVIQISYNDICICVAAGCRAP